MLLALGLRCNGLILLARFALLAGPLWAPSWDRALKRKHNENYQAKNKEGGKIRFREGLFL